MSDEPSRMTGTNKARKMLVQSEKALNDILRAFDVMAERMLAGEDVPAADLAKSLTTMSQARTRLINEVKEHENTVLFSEGRLADAPLDLEAIRAEIGRRIDSIRSDRDTERLS